MRTRKKANNYHTIIFEGGGVKGYAYAEALKALAEKNIIDLSKINTYVGSSAGAITAALCACGATAEDLEEFLEADFNIFKDDEPGFFRDFWNLYRYWGLCGGKVFSEWFKSCLEHLGQSIQSLSYENNRFHPNHTPIITQDITFRELHQETGKELIITASNFSRGTLKLFSHETTPNTPVWFGVRASMAIPVFFRPVNYCGDWLWDGGVLANLYDPKGDGGELALRLVGNDDYGKGKKREIKNIFDVVMCVVDILQYQAERRHISESLWENMISINTGNVKATDFDLTTSQKQQLADAGRKAVVHFWATKGKK